MSTQTLLDPTPAALLTSIHSIGLTDDQRKILTPLVDTICENSVKRLKVLSLIAETLSQIRLDMKYLIFDLEATRRERDKYKEKLNDR